MSLVASSVTSSLGRRSAPRIVAKVSSQSSVAPPAPSWGNLETKKHALVTKPSSPAAPISYAAAASDISGTGQSAVKSNIMLGKTDNQNWNDIAGISEQLGNTQVSTQSQNGASWSSKRPLDRRYDYKQYQDGTVFSTAIHEEDGFQQAPAPGDTNQSASALGGTVYSKNRQFIVIARFTRHCIALPIYTHEGHGLRYKITKDEHISIRDIDLEKSAAAGENSYGVLWAE